MPPAVRILGKAGTFYSLAGDTTLNTEQTFDQVGVAGWAPHGGKTFSWSEFADGKVFVGNQDLRGNSTQPTGTDLSLSIFDPVVPSLTHLQVPTDQGHTDVIGPNGVTGGAPMGAVAKVNVAGEDWIVFMSGAPYGGWQIAGHGVFPFLTVVRKIAGTWQVDTAKSMTADQLRASGGAGSAAQLAFPDTVNSFGEHLADVRGAAEMGALPGSTAVVVTQYFNENRPSGAKGGSLVVIDVPTKTVLAYYEVPYAGADPAVTDMGMRSVLVEPRATGGVRRAVVLSDCYNAGAAAGINVLQEFAIDLVANTITPISVPMKDAKAGRHWGNGCIDSSGALWLVEEGQNFLAGDVCVFRTPRATQRMPYLASVHASWARQPFKACEPDIRVVMPAGTQLPWGKALEDPATGTVMWQSLNAKVIALRRRGRGRTMRVTLLHTVDLDYKNQVETPEAPAARGRLIPGQPCLDPVSRIVWWPIGQLDSATTTPVYPSPAPLQLDEYMYMLDPDRLWAEPGFVRSISGQTWATSSIRPGISTIWRPGDKVVILVSLVGGGESRTFKTVQGWTKSHDKPRTAAGLGGRWALFSKTMRRGDRDPTIAWDGGVLNCDWIATSFRGSYEVLLEVIASTVAAPATTATRPSVTTRRPGTRIVGFYGADGSLAFSGLAGEIARRSDNGAGLNPSSLFTDEELPVGPGVVTAARTVTFSASKQSDAITVALVVDPPGLDPELAPITALSGLADDQRTELASVVVATPAARGGGPADTARPLREDVRTYLQVLDQNERPLYEIHDITDGGVTLDESQTPEASLDVTVLDPDARTFGYSPAEEALEARRFVRAIYERATSKGWVRHHLFTGPLTSGSVRRRGAEVQITAKGKESLYLAPYQTYEAQNFPKRTRAVDGIRAIAARQGETRFRLHEYPDLLVKPFGVPRFTDAWPLMERLAAMIGGRVPYFDGSGYLALRKPTSKRIAFVFDGQVVLGPPEVSDDFTTLVNFGVATGPDPSGPQKPPESEVPLGPVNPLSPVAMARNGIPRRAIAVASIGSRRTAKLHDAAREQLHTVIGDISFDTLPIAWLRLGLRCRVRGTYDGISMDRPFVLRRVFVPLTVNQPGTIGSWKPLAPLVAPGPSRGGSK